VTGVPSYGRPDSGRPTYDDVEEAAGRLDGVAHRTPILTSRILDQRVGAQVALKSENLQRAGAFKFRGAYNRIAAIPRSQRAAGVVAYSSGNHAQAVALAASLLGLKATIVMPRDTPASKLAATEGYGAEIVHYDRYSEDRVVIGEALAAERGATLVPPYDDPLIIAGQATAARELHTDWPGLDLLLVPVGGGGLIAGSAISTEALSPSTRIVGVEPDTGDDTRQSLASGARLRIEVPRTIADGLQGDIPGLLTFPIVQKLVDEIVTVSDEEIVEAMVLLHDRLKTVTEPSGAVGVAALLSGKVDLRGARRIGVILSGGNVGAARFGELVRTVG
jgi:threonine dehydratase